MLCYLTLALILPHPSLLLEYNGKITANMFQLLRFRLFIVRSILCCVCCAIRAHSHLEAKIY